MSLRNPTIINVYVDVDDTKQIEIAEEMLQALAPVQAMHMHMHIRVEIPAVSSQLPQRFVQPLIGPVKL